MRSEEKVALGRSTFSILHHKGDESRSFMEVVDDDLRRSIIREYQEFMSTANFTELVCAVCGRGVRENVAKRIHASHVKLSLLRNEGLPDKVRPSTYDFNLYGGALLCPDGLSERWMLGELTMCGVCYREVVEVERMPKLSLANWLYYGRDELPAPVRDAFRCSTQCDRLLVARARGSRISFRFTELQAKKKGKGQKEESRRGHCAADQRFVKGNVLVMPQNSTTFNQVLPPPPSVIRDTVCAVFIGQSPPTKDTIEGLGPILARKSRVSTIIQFLVQENDHYMCDTSFHGYSARNMDLLFEGQMLENDEGVPCAMEIGYVRDADGTRSVGSDYTNRGRMPEPPLTGNEVLMENVGYTSGDDSPVSYRDMKMKALMHCLAGGKFVQSRAGDRFIPDFENPSLMTWMFPHLDPWGIGGFHQEERLIPLSMEEQLRYLLELHKSPFAKDADFAFVYYNILQKKQVCDSVKFKVKASQQREIVNRLLSVDRDLLGRLIESYRRNPGYEPSSMDEKSLLALVNKVGAVLHDIPGTSGYKIKMRNEIRGLVTHLGTPAFFITLNPSDIHHPLVRLFAGENIQLEDIESGEELSEWGRRLLVARNPGACAKFFHTVISSFISVILRYGRKDRGLLGV
ncbi:hypothetical protein C8Q76DRAFT_607330, partial [Earliella scabrosa]